jgi:branched-chain amino acid transport system substrate-binding protein
MLIRTAVLMLLALACAAHAESGAAPENFVVGQSVELTGQATGKENMLGALAYFSWLNAHGGVHGHAIELKSYDDRRDRATTIRNTEKLVHQDHALALFGYRSTPTVEAVLPLLRDEKVALVAPFSGAHTLHEPVHPYVFNLRASYQTEATKMVESLTTLQITRVAILAQDDAFGRDGQTGFERSLEARKLTPLVIARYDRKTLDLRQSVSAIAAANPQAVLMACTPTACANFIKQIRKLHLQPQFLMLSNVNSEEFFDSLGDYGRGIGVMQVMPYPRDIGVGVVREFEHVLKQMKEPPPASYAVLEGFVAAKLMAEAIRRAGPHPTRQKLVDALDAMHDFDLGGISVSYSPTDHDGSSFVELTIVGKNGAIWR